MVVTPRIWYLFFFLNLRILQLGTFVVFVWWAAVIKSVSAVFTFIFGKDYRLAMFGKNIKKNLFLLDESIVVTNNGSYGTIPKKVKETQWKYQVILTLINVFFVFGFLGVFYYR